MCRKNLGISFSKARQNSTTSSSTGLCFEKHLNNEAAVLVLKSQMEGPVCWGAGAKAPGKLVLSSLEVKERSQQNCFYSDSFKVIILRLHLRDRQVTVVMDIKT